MRLHKKSGLYLDSNMEYRKYILIKLVFSGFSLILTHTLGVGAITEGITLPGEDNIIYKD